MDLSSENDGNLVTQGISTGEKDGYRQAELKEANGNQFQQEKKDESYQVTADSGGRGDTIDLSKYAMVIRHAEGIVGDDRLPSFQVGIRMNKTAVQEIEFLKGLLIQAVCDPHFSTTLSMEREGDSVYFFNRKEESMK